MLTRLSICNGRAVTVWLMLLLALASPVGRSVGRSDVPFLLCSSLSRFLALRLAWHGSVSSGGRAGGRTNEQTTGWRLVDGELQKKEEAFRWPNLAMSCTRQLIRLAAGVVKRSVCENQTLAPMKDSCYSAAAPCYPHTLSPSNFSNRFPLFPILRCFIRSSHLSTAALGFPEAKQEFVQTYLFGERNDQTTNTLGDGHRR